MVAIKDRQRRVARKLAATSSLVVGLALAAACSRTAAPAPSGGVVVDPTPWVRDLATDDLFVSEPAIAKLINLGDAALPALADAYGRGDTQQRLNIVEVAAGIGTPAAVALLARASNDADDEVRDEALGELEALKLPEGSAAVEAAVVEHADRPSRAAVNACVALCRSRVALERLLSDAIHGAPADKRVLRNDGMRILHSDPERGALVDALLERIATPLLGPETPMETRLRAALLTAYRDPTTAQPILLAYAEEGDDARLRTYATLAVAESGDEKAVPALRRLSRSSNPTSVMMACRTLGALRARGVVVADDDLSGCMPPGTGNRP